MQKHRNRISSLVCAVVLLVAAVGFTVVIRAPAAHAHPTCTFTTRWSMVGEGEAA